MSDPAGQTAPVPTERLARVLALASDEADGLGHGFVTCQHLLYALSRETKGLASAVLDGLGISAEALHAMLVESAALHDRTAQGQIDLADEAREAISLAAQVAHQWGHRTLDTEHLLYGILATSTSADELLNALNVRPGDVLSQLTSLQQTAPQPVIRDEATHAYRFTLETAWLLGLAVDSARSLGAARVASVHVLLALLSLESPAREVLVSGLGLEVDNVLREIHAASTPWKSSGRLPLSEDVQRILGYAIGEAWNRGHLAVAPLHIAVGLARAERHAALDLLADLGISQAELLQALDRAMPPPVRR